MDPNEALAIIRKAIKLATECDWQDDAFQHLNEAAFVFEDLDAWLSNNGFLPEAWSGNKL